MSSSQQNMEALFLQQVANPALDFANPKQTLWLAATAILAAFVLALMIVAVYRQTHRGLQYSRSFVFTLALVAPITSIIMVVVEGSLARAFAVLGALSIIRFRTAVKDTTDLAYVFWAIAIGLCTGTGHYLTGIAATALLASIVGVMAWMRFGAGNANDFVLRFSVDSSNGAESHYLNAFKRMLKKATLLDMHTVGDGKMMDVVYAVSFNNTASIRPFVQELGAIHGVDRIGLVNSREEVEA